MFGSGKGIEMARRWMGWGLVTALWLLPTALPALAQDAAREAATAPATALAETPLAKANARIAVWDLPDVDQLPDDDYGRLVRYGRSVLVATPSHIGPNAADPAMRFAGNNLACANCHLNAGTKKFGLPLIAAAADYPSYSARSGHKATLADRLDGCMTRSMNGRPLPTESKSMRALVAYLELLGKSVPPGGKIVGGGAGRIAELDRPADPVRGAALYKENCAFCHGPDGHGLIRDPEAPSLGYGVPPLWGPGSFNDGAGMNRLITIANFVHNNMPNGTSWVMPQIAPEDAWDIGAFVVSQDRPRRAGLDRDFPDLLQKPVDAPYGPYADEFTETQHRFGPFAPIRAALARLKADKGTVPNPNVK